MKYLVFAVVVIWSQTVWSGEPGCENGVSGHTLPGGDIVDCLTDEHAIAVEFAEDWQQGVTRALWLASNTGRRAGLILFLESREDKKLVKRAKRLVGHYGLPLDIWTESGYKVPDYLTIIETYTLP